MRETAFFQKGLAASVMLTAFEKCKKIKKITTLQDLLKIKSVLELTKMVKIHC